MGPLEIADLIKSKFSSDVKDVVEFQGQVSVLIKRDNVREIMRFLRQTPELYFDYLVDLCGVDYLGKKEVRFEVVYHLMSIKYNHMIRIKAEVPEDDCSIDSVVDIWATANWHERECFDMYGIVFKGHPDLRRILMPEDWEGFPLRKDYPLKSDLGAKEWKKFKEVIEIGKKNLAYEVR
ncbi:MAG: NADH-quinone oxidoreductase subunit C [Thermodesulfovibrionales bacterium]|nr:NADH-quinone oxidoreductase subunit C [Thermodesulfovibrionales bacterium]